MTKIIFIVYFRIVWIKIGKWVEIMSLINIINELAVSNMDDSLNFYKNIFGFEIEYTDGNPTVWAQIKKDNLILMLEDYKTVNKEIKNFPMKTNSCNLIIFEYDNLDEVKSVYDTCKNHQCIFFMDYVETEYGKIEFGIKDLDNNMILISFKK